MMFRTPRALEIQATLPPEGAAVISVGNAALSTWSMVNGWAQAQPATSIPAANRLMSLLYAARSLISENLERLAAENRKTRQPARGGRNQGGERHGGRIREQIEPEFDLHQEFQNQRRKTGSQQAPHDSGGRSQDQKLHREDSRNSAAGRAQRFQNDNFADAPESCARHA